MNQKIRKSEKMQEEDQKLASLDGSPLLRCWAEIDEAALSHNIAIIRTHLGPHPRLMAVVKANAYGHGLDGILRALAGQVEMFGVANLEEALDVREVLPEAEVLILGAALPAEREAMVRQGFCPVISTLEEARAYSALGSPEKPLKVHLAIDTGMGRLGFLESKFEAALPAILALPGLEIAAVATHLPVPDEDVAYTNDQLTRYENLLRRIRPLIPGAAISHSLNSAGIIAFPGHAGDLVRAGLMLYGSSPIPTFQAKLRAVMTLKSRVTLIRELPAGHGISYGRTFVTAQPTRVATVAAGYADGYQRRLSNQSTSVLIHGQRCPVLGRVTMDQIMIDITDLPEVEIGDEVVLFGKQGGAKITAAELAEKAGTIPWEIFTGISKRVPRIFQATAG